MKIITVPNPILSKIAKNIDTIDSSILKIVEEMGRVLVAQDDPPGTGISAPQVGLSIRLFLIKPKTSSPISVIINPKILELKNNPEKVTTRKRRIPLEGCLSVPRIWGEVKRYDKVLMEYQNETGKKQKKWFSGFESIIVQHEYDHLDGILFTQRVLEQGRQLYEEQGDELVKISF